jgi:hypothetical protein
MNLSIPYMIPFGKASKMGQKMKVIAVPQGFLATCLSPLSIPLSMPATRKTERFTENESYRCNIRVFVIVDPRVYAMSIPCLSPVCLSPRTPLRIDRVPIARPLGRSGTRSRERKTAPEREQNLPLQSPLKAGSAQKPTPRKNSPPRSQPPAEPSLPAPGVLKSRQTPLPASFNRDGSRPLSRFRSAATVRQMHMHQRVSP